MHSVYYMLLGIRVIKIFIICLLEKLWINTKFSKHIIKIEHFQLNPMSHLFISLFFFCKTLFDVMFCVNKYRTYRPPTFFYTWVLTGRKNYWTVFVFRIIYLVISQAIRAFRSLLSIFLFFKQKDPNCLLGLLVFQHPCSHCFTVSHAMYLNHECNREWTVNITLFYRNVVKL